MILIFVEVEHPTHGPTIVEATRFAMSRSEIGPTRGAPTLGEHLFENAVLTGSDDFFLGHGEEDAEGGALRPTPTSLRAEVLPMLREILLDGAANQMEAESLLAIGKVGAFTGDDEGFIRFSFANLPLEDFDELATRLRAFT